MFGRFCGWVSRNAGTIITVGLFAMLAVAVLAVTIAMPPAAPGTAAAAAKAASAMAIPLGI